MGKGFPKVMNELFLTVDRQVTRERRASQTQAKPIWLLSMGGMSWLKVIRMAGLVPRRNKTSPDSKG